MMLQGNVLNHTDQVLRLKTEAYHTVRHTRTKPFNTFSISTTFGEISNEPCLYDHACLATKCLQPIHLSFHS